jgi:hypothetical protein
MIPPRKTASAMLTKRMWISVRLLLRSRPLPLNASAKHRNMPVAANHLRLGIGRYLSVSSEPARPRAFLRSAGYAKVDTYVWPTPSCNGVVLATVLQWR